MLNQPLMEKRQSRRWKMSGIKFIKQKSYLLLTIKTDILDLHFDNFSANAIICSIYVYTNFQLERIVYWKIIKTNEWLGIIIIILVMSETDKF